MTYRRFGHLSRAGPITDCHIGASVGEAEVFPVLPPVASDGSCRSEKAFGIEQDADRTVVDALDVHVSLKDAFFDR